ncbi:hypothetical protein ACLOJK_023248 [Asimina triloba]
MDYFIKIIDFGCNGLFERGKGYGGCNNFGGTGGCHYQTKFGPASDPSGLGGVGGLGLLWEVVALVACCSRCRSIHCINLLAIVLHMGVRRIKWIICYHYDLEILSGLIPLQIAMSLKDHSIKQVLYAIGGYDGMDMVSSVEVFDPRTSSWESGESLNHARGYAAAVVLGELIYLIGGVRDGESIVDANVTRKAVAGGLPILELSARGVSCLLPFCDAMLAWCESSACWHRRVIRKLGSCGRLFHKHFDHVMA